MDQEPFVDTPQLAEHLSVSESWVRKQVLYADIPTHRLGRSVRFKISEVEGWLQSAQ